MVCAQLWASRETPEDALILVSEHRHIGIQSEHCSAVGWACADELFVGVRHFSGQSYKNVECTHPCRSVEVYFRYNVDGVPYTRCA